MLTHDQKQLGVSLTHYTLLMVSSVKSTSIHLCRMPDSSPKNENSVIMTEFHPHVIPNPQDLLSSSQIFTKLTVLRNEACSDWSGIQCVVIGRIPQA